MKDKKGKFLKGNIPHNKGKTKENYEPLRRASKNISKATKERVPWNKGRPRTEKTIKKISETKIRLFKEGKIKPLGCAQKGDLNYGKTHKYWLGKSLSEKHRKNISETLKKLIKGGKIDSFFKSGEENFMYGKRGNKHPSYGKPLSEKTKKKISKANKGRYRLEKNPNWQGGKSFEPYTKFFNKQFKLEIRERDGQICVLCGKHQNELPQTLLVHHIDYNKQLTTQKNCCSLCRSCHTTVNFNRKYWTKFFQRLLINLYILDKSNN